MTRGRLETEIIRSCGPALAGLKTANLFSFKFTDAGLLTEEVGRINGHLNPRGVFVEIMLMREDSALIYVYRKSHLERDLSVFGVRDFLANYGYFAGETDACIMQLKERLRTSACFPHEIGLFLGYPLPDVIGFIRNRGRNCKCCGFWKVYSNEWETRQLFEKFRKCLRVYAQVLVSERSIAQLTVVA